MDAEEQPADPDNMKEQVLVSPLQDLPFYICFSVIILKKTFVVTVFCLSIVSLFQLRLRAQFLLIPPRVLPL